ncbi:MAG: hypothetical protein QOG52_166 [Frankiaceae bacterium]|jgi:hypothetical protein|nr:hypothetical protein [Frankiaceae bacterium]MDQ1723138.1 hypothetical protein [Frankiaceae bacterium]
MAVPGFENYPLAPDDHEWKGAEADKRVRSWAGADNGPNAKYRDAHLWYDENKPYNFTSYKLLICDVIDGKLRAVPRGIMAVANVVMGGRGGVDIPPGDVDRVRDHLAMYYKKMNETPPWEDD